MLEPHQGVDTHWSCLRHETAYFELEDDLSAVKSRINSVPLKSRVWRDFVSSLMTIFRSRSLNGSIRYCMDFFRSPPGRSRTNRRSALVGIDMSRKNRIKSIFFIVSVLLFVLDIPKGIAVDKIRVGLPHSDQIDHNSPPDCEGRPRVVGAVEDGKASRQCRLTLDPDALVIDISIAYP